MKTLFVFALVCVGQLAFAENLVTKDGRIYENVAIVSADPVRLLIVHDGGGCQVDYADLAPGSLSAQQRKAIEEGLKEYADRQIRMEELRQKAEALRLEQQAFSQAQREKGLILFEDAWMKPEEKREILANRELDHLKQERLRVELDKQKLELRKAQMIAEENERLRTSPKQTYTYYYSYPSYSSRRCETQNRVPVCKPNNGLSISYSSRGSSISYNTAGSHVRTRVDCIRR